MRSVITVSFYVFIASALAGCGQVGPLYMPGEEEVRAEADAPAVSDPRASEPGADLDTGVGGELETYPEPDPSPELEDVLQ